MNAASLILRVFLGLMFCAHGLQKAFGALDGPGIKGFAQMLHGLGFFPPILWAYIAAYVELIGGIFLILGVATRISASFLFVLIVVAALKMHVSHGFFLMNGGFEYAFIIAGVCLALIFMGPGKFSVMKKF